MAEKDQMRVLEHAFTGDQAPAELSVSIVSLVELCQLAMPHADEVRKRLAEAGFEPGGQKPADDAARMLALDNKLVDMPVHNLKNQIFGRTRHESPVVFLLSEGETPNGKIVFLSTLFRGANEADTIKAGMHVVKSQPVTGAKVENNDGYELRRVIWDAKGAGNVRGFVVTGPADIEIISVPRAITAFNWVK